MHLCSNEEVMKLFWNMEPQEETTYKTRWNLNFPDFFFFMRKGIKVFIRTQLTVN